MLFTPHFIDDFCNRSRITHHLFFKDDRVLKKDDRVLKKGDRV